MQWMNRVLGASAVPAMLIAAGCACPPVERVERVRVVAEERLEVGCVTVYLPTGEQRSSVVSLRKCGPEAVIAGQPFEYNIVVTNLADDIMLRNVLVRDVVPPGVTITDGTRELAGVRQPAMPPAMADARDPRLLGQPVGMEDEAVFHIGTLSPRESATVRIQATATAEGRVVNCATASYDIFACIATDVTAPEIRIMLDAPSEVLLCPPVPSLPIRAMVRNTGTGVARDARVRFMLPEGVTAEQDVVLRVGDLAAGQTQEVSTNLRVTQPGRYTIGAMARADGLETRAETITILAVMPEIDLQVRGPEEDYIGLGMTFEGIVTNTGDGPLPDTRVVMNIPSGVMFVEAADGGMLEGNTVVWRFGRIEPGASRTFAVRLRAAEQARELRVVFNAIDPCAADREGFVMTRLIGVPAILVEMIDHMDPIRVGEEEVYEIRVTNQGSADQTGVIITAQVPEAMEYIRSEGPTRGTQDEVDVRTIRFEPLPTLPPGETAVWLVTTRALRPADARFALRVDSDQHTRPIEETEATRIFD